MKRMNWKRMGWVVMWIMMGLACMTALAQTNGGEMPIDGLATEPLPKSTFEFWTFGIAMIAPIIVWLVRKMVPSIPKLLLPSMTPFVGIALGFILKFVGAANLSWVDMAQAGALAVFVREVVNQAVTKNLEPEVPEVISPSYDKKRPS